VPTEVIPDCAIYPDPDRRNPVTAFVERNGLRVIRRLCAARGFFRCMALMRDVDIVYVNTTLRHAPVHAGWLMRKRVVIHVREAENYLSPTTARGRRRLARLFSHADTVICVSQAVRRLVLDIPGTGLGPDQVATVHNGINSGDFARDPGAGEALRDRLGIPREAIVVAFVGNTTERKGLDIFLQAASRLLDTRDDLHFLIAGGKPENVARFRAAYLETSRLDHVHFLGFVDDTRPVLWAADIFAMLSRIEPFARVNLEASSAGCAIVATPADGNAELYADGENALIVPVGDTPATVSAIARLADDGALRDRLAARAVAVVRDRFTLEGCNDRIAALLDDGSSR
jgi:glycosyltransferase involved in cell wall biosynthesis